jgi:hypothetical protein
MDALLSFIGSLIVFCFIVGIIMAGVALWGYNTLRALSENIREGWSNIGVVGKKQVSLMNQLIDVVKGYQESEKLVMLKVSDDVTSANQLAQIHQQSTLVMSAAGGMAQKFPELKSNQQYQRLIDSMQACEAQLESARQRYNASVKNYNVTRSSIPHVFYAGTLGFKNAPYLEFDGETPMLEVGKMKDFMNDDDGERLNKLLGQVGSKVLEAGSKAGTLAIEAGSKAGSLAIEAGNKAIEGGKHVAEVTQEKIKQRQEAKAAEAAEEAAAEQQAAEVAAAAEQQAAEEAVVAEPSCPACHAPVSADSAFCGACGTKLH